MFNNLNTNEHPKLFLHSEKIKLTKLRFNVLTATSMKMTVFYDVAPCSLVDILTDFSEEPAVFIIKVMNPVTIQKTTILKLTTFPCLVTYVLSPKESCTLIDHLFASIPVKDTSYFSRKISLQRACKLKCTVWGACQLNWVDSILCVFVKIHGASSSWRQCSLSSLIWQLSWLRLSAILCTHLLIG
jgi:hypothetical protein